MEIDSHKTDTTKLCQAMSKVKAINATHCPFKIFLRDYSCSPRNPLSNLNNSDPSSYIEEVEHQNITSQEFEAQSSQGQSTGGSNNLYIPIFKGRCHVIYMFYQCVSGGHIVVKQTLQLQMLTV